MESVLHLIRIWLKDQTTGRSETFGEAGRHVTNVGAGLARLGVCAGTVVCVWASNYVEYWLVSIEWGQLSILCVKLFFSLVHVYPIGPSSCSQN